MYEVTEELNADQTDEETTEAVDTTETTELAEESATQETEAEATETAEPVKPFIKVKHSNADIELAEQEAVDAIQQGLFVKDHGGTEAVKWMLKKAKDAGFATIADYQAAVDRQMLEADAAKLEEEEFIPHERAMEIVEARQSKAAIEAQKQAKEAAEMQIKKYELELAEFRAEYPEVDVPKLIANLPADIKEAKQKYPEKSLADLYARHLLKQVKSTEHITAQAAKNKGSSTGNLKSDKDNSSGAYYDNISALILGK